MALKKQFSPLAAFSMSSMADVIFLLLIFFMITSTLITPSAMDVNLPQSSEQSVEKPHTEVYIDADSQLYFVADRTDSLTDSRMPRKVQEDELQASLRLLKEQGALQSVALYADSAVPYAAVVKVLDMSARNDIKMVLATRPVSAF